MMELVVLELSFGDWLREKRRDLRLTATEAAKRSGMPQSVWSRLESGESRSKSGAPPRPEMATCERIALGLGIPVREVLKAAGYPVKARDDADDGPPWEAYYDELPPTEQQEIDDYVEWRYQQWLRRNMKGGKAE